MSTDTLQKPLKALGVTPWQLILLVAAVAFWLGEIKPKLALADELASSVIKLTETVQSLSTKVEVHAVLLTNIAEIKAEVRQMRSELSTIEGKLAHASASTYRTKNEP